MATTYIKTSNGIPLSPNYYAVWYDLNGERQSRSTGTTKKREAAKLANKWEFESHESERAILKDKQETAELMLEECRKLLTKKQKDRTHHAFIKLITRLYEIENGVELKLPTLREYLCEWMTHQKNKVYESTYKSYQQSINSLEGCSSEILDKKLIELVKGDLKEMQKALVKEADKKGTTRKTINYKMEVITGALREAYGDGLLANNITFKFGKLPEEDSKIKVPFTQEEIEKIIQHAPTSWKGLILFGAYTGTRITNCATLRWEDIDRENRLILIEPVKQKRTLKPNQRKCIPFYLRDCLWNYLNFIGFKDEGYIFPDIQGLHRDTRSKKFVKLMERAGVPKSITLHNRKDEHGNPRIGWRSFHSLRHSFNSFLANSGVSQDTRKKYTGHSTNSANNRYTHEDVEAIREELQSLPEINWAKAVM